MLRRALLLYTSMIAGASACSDGNGKGYLVQLSDSPVVVDGSLAPGEWEQGEKLTNFSFPWLEEKAPLTEFVANTDGIHFNFAFRAEDDKLVVKPHEKELDVASGDRVEIFLPRIRH